MKKHVIFKIEDSGIQPVYVFSKDSWVGLTMLLQPGTNSTGIIKVISFWQFIKEWFTNDSNKKS